MIAGVRTIGCRRVGGGFAGAPFETNMAAGAALAASLDPGAIIFEGSGACIPPVEADRTVCIVGDRAAGAVRGRTGCCAPTWCWRRDGRAGPAGRRGPVLAPGRAGRGAAGRRARGLLQHGRHTCARASSRWWPRANLARRAALAADLDRAAEEGCDVYLTELKAAAIDTVAVRARPRARGSSSCATGRSARRRDLDRALRELADA